MGNADLGGDGDGDDGAGGAEDDLMAGGNGAGDGADGHAGGGGRGDGGDGDGGSGRAVGQCGGVGEGSRLKVGREGGRGHAEGGQRAEGRLAVELGGGVHAVVLQYRILVVGTKVPGVVAAGYAVNIHVPVGVNAGGSGGARSALGIWPVPGLVDGLLSAMPLLMTSQ